MIESIKQFLIRKLNETTATDEDVTKFYLACRELGFTEQDILNLGKRQIHAIYASL